MFDIKQFYDDYGIDWYDGDHAHKHCRDGWINTECPRCSGNPGLHLGFSEQTGQFVCWRCGYMPVIEAIRRITGESWQKSKAIVRYYGGARAADKRYTKTAKEKDIDVVFPKGTLDKLPKRHKAYLENRGFDPDHITDVWGIKATGKKGSYANRIIAPVYYRGILMSYQGRDITNEHFAKYMACKMENEKRHHKHCLYGIDLAIGNACLVVEGYTDVWRMGIGAVGTFGIKYTKAQLLLLYHHFDRIFILFDETEEEAQKKASELMLNLRTLGKEAEHITLGIDHDPGELSDKDARYVMRELLIR